MGFASASREEKFKMMRTNKSKKAVKRLNKMGKKGKVNKKIIGQLTEVKKKKAHKSLQRARDIEDDWVAEREVQYANEEEVLPLDMMDADIDWEHSAFASMKRRWDETKKAFVEGEDDSEDDLERKRRRFAGVIEDDREELLPIKLKDGTIVRPTRKKGEVKQEDEQVEEEESEEVEEKEEKEVKQEFEDYSHLSATQLLAKRKELVEESKQKISDYAHSLLENPQENIYRLRDLYHLCVGKNAHPIVRETIQKLATASILQVLVDIIPGYAIRPQTEEEKKQKQKKETKLLVSYEETLLRYYLKFLQFCEGFMKKVSAKDKVIDEATFTYKLGMICIKAVSRLVLSSPHFNYSTNIVSALVRTSLSRNKTVVEEVCGAISRVFKEDISLQMTLFTARSISAIITKRKGRVPAQLVATLLNANITEVKKEENHNEKGRLTAKKYQIKQERENKSTRKYKKQLERVEADLKLIEAQESISTKLKRATEAMKHIFQCFFSILKRMPNVSLLEPTLEGLSKFAHLLSIEFFDDILATMEDLVDREDLRVVDRLHSIHTAFVILSGEGQLLNIDPGRFYKSIYSLLNLLPLEKKPENRHTQLLVLTKTLHIMILDRRKQVPLPRVAAFVKRLLCCACLTDDVAALTILSLIRTFFIGHPKLNLLVEEDEEEGVRGGSSAPLGTGAIFRADVDNPDLANALSESIREELKLLRKKREKAVGQFANNLLNSVTSTGPHKLDPQLSTRKPWELLNQAVQKFGGNYPEPDMHMIKDLEQYAKKRHKPLTHSNLHLNFCNWLAERSKHS
ncbi:hypothetical protein WR25_09895 [Diploscapter pachys]|uniref:NOC3-like protein n=1 Tax=Diploscapter pachys TaxID=2018661 RepID=A0A2A2JCK7_9BILA|nr:hypothetical protein WR25_09895 [Diploscapter pachys]